MAVRYPVPPIQPTPRGFVDHAFEREFDVAFAATDVWAWLNDPRTFTEGQPWPYFVEFVEGGFETGVLNTHTGPGIHFPGVIGEIRAPHYRDLVYLYGARVLSMRWIRPTRLQFWVATAADGRGARVKVRVDSQVRPWIRGLWSIGNRVFWSGFGWTIRRGVARRLRHDRDEERTRPQQVV